MITVITATMPGREQVLLEAIGSVQAQIVKPHAHLIRSASPPEEWGPNPLHLAEQHNALLASVDTEWLAILDDDNIWYSHYLQVLSENLDGHDVVYCYADGPLPRMDVNEWSNQEIVDYLGQSNFLDANALIRTSALRDVGGFPIDFDWETGRFGDTRCTWDDWALWLRMAEAGKKFHCVPMMGWQYRQGFGTHSSQVWASHNY